MPRLPGSKSAVNGLTRVLSKEFGPRKIRVNALSPGGTETEGAHAAGVMGTESKRQIIASTPLGRLSQPGDIARVAVFLASDDAGWLTGEIIFRTTRGGFPRHRQAHLAAERSRPEVGTKSVSSAIDRSARSARALASFASYADPLLSHTEIVSSGPERHSDLGNAETS
jgi:NAD(P)-dependent dehydrogenase (short-subunit alcohol dehydrogenase family)